MFGAEKKINEAIAAVNAKNKHKALTYFQEQRSCVRKKKRRWLSAKPKPQKRRLS